MRWKRSESIGNASGRSDRQLRPFVRSKSNYLFNLLVSGKAGSVLQVGRYTATGRPRWDADFRTRKSVD